MTRAFRHCVLAAVLMAAVLAACGESATEPAANSASVQGGQVASAPTVRIRGVVTLKGDVPAARVERVTENQGVCGSSVPMTRLTLGPNAAVSNAFIYLDGIKGTGVPRRRATLELAQQRCSYAPRAMVAPVGAALEIINDDPILHNVHAREATPDGLRTIFNIAQPVRGQRTMLDAPFKRAGVVTLTCEAGHPWMAAYVLVADHPYVAVSGHDGEFTIENVPPGTYPIHLWHEGVTVKRIVPHLQQYEYEEPYELAAEVVVPPQGEAVVNFELALRKDL